MDNRQLVELITAEVVKALKETGLMDTGSSANYGDTDFGSGLLSTLQAKNIKIQYRLLILKISLQSTL